MASAKTVFHWRPEEPNPDPHPGLDLTERLCEAAADRASSARELVHEVSTELWFWLSPMGESVAPADLVRDLEAGWTEFLRAHAWRGTIARWESALRGVIEHKAPRMPSCSLRELLLEEVGLWLGGEQAGAAQIWCGEPLADGVRLPDRQAGPRRVLASFERAEIILVHGWSESIAIALETLFEQGLAPRVICSEGGADLGGRRLARRLSAVGVDVTLVYDMALFDHLRAADRLWVGSEAIGAGAFLARRGVGALLHAARELDVERTVVATSDKLTPSGHLQVPTWPLEQAWLLWEDAPAGVSLDTQHMERVPAALASHFLTEAGFEHIAELALRALPASEKAAQRVLQPQPSRRIEPIEKAAPRSVL